MSFSRFPAPEVSSVPADKRLYTGVLFDEAARILTRASLRHVPTNGIDFFLRQEVVDLAPGSRKGEALGLTRPEWDKDKFVLESTETGHIGDVRVSRDGTNLEGRGVKRFKELAQKIGDGALRGAHTVTGLKVLELEESDRPVMLEASLTRTTNPRQIAPTTALDLRLIRYYTDDGAMFTQIGRFEMDPNAGDVRSGYTNLNEQWIHTPNGEELFADPLPDDSARNLQVIHRPLMRVDEPITTEMWISLTTLPLNPFYMLKK